VTAGRENGTGEPLGELRARIDELDRKTIGLLAERFRLVAELGRVKRGAGLSIEDARREARLRELHAELARSEGLPPELVERLFAIVIASSKEAQAQAARAQAAPANGASEPAARPRSD